MGVFPLTNYMLGSEGELVMISVNRKGHICSDFKAIITRFTHNHDGFRFQSPLMLEKTEAISLGRAQQTAPDITGSIGKELN